MSGSFGIAGVSEPRGVTTNAAGSPMWVLDQSDQISVFDPASHALLGSWHANGLQNPQDLTTDGTNLWIVDGSSHRVYYFAGGAAFRSGDHAATSSFCLASCNDSPTGIATNGTLLWVSDNHADKVFVYAKTGCLQGSWQLDPANGDASGLTVRQSGDGPVWVVDRADGAVYYYAGATTRRCGIQAADSALALAAGNTRPEGIVDPSIPITVGSSVSGDISVAGEADEYSFDGLAGQNLFFNVEIGLSSDFSWQLTGPDATPIFFTDYSSYGAITLAATGSYTLTIRGQGSQTGDYGFAIYDIPTPVATPITLGQTVDGEIAMPGEYDVYTFSGSPGQMLYFDMPYDYAWYLSWSLTSPSGVHVFDSNSPEQGPIALTESGQYTLVVDGALDNVLPYQFTVQEVPTSSATPIMLGETVSGELVEPGEYDVYTLDATAGQLLYFNAPNYGGEGDSVRWRLVAPSGAQLFESDEFASRGPLTLTESGQYILVIDDYYDFNYLSYEFTVFEVPAPVTTPITIGETVSGEITSPGQFDIYTFDATAGQTLYFNSMSEDDLGWELTSPNGEQLFSIDYLQDQGPMLLAESGQYTLKVLGKAELLPYQFVINDVPAAITTSITIGQTVDGTLPVPGQSGIYIFDATAGQKFYFDAGSAQWGTLKWKLTSPSGSQIFYFTDFSDQETPLLSESGQYSLEIGNTANGSVSFQFIIREIPPPVITPITAGQLVSGQIATPGEYDIYTFDGAAGQTLFFDVKSGSSSQLRWTLTSPGGSQQFGYYSDQGPITLTASGQYSLTIDAYSAYLPSYQFIIHDVPAPIATPIAMEQTVGGQISVPGESAIYTFNAVTGEELYFDAISGSVSWKLISPSSQQIFNSTYFGDQGPLSMSETGQYSLIVYGRYDNVSPYQFLIHQISAPTTTPITIGQTVDGQIAAAGDSIRYAFDAAANQTLFFDVLGDGTAPLNWTLTAPSGSQLFPNENFFDRGPLSLTESGQYILTVANEASGSSSFQFIIHDVPAPVTTAISIGQTVDGQITVPGQYAIYTFDAAAGQKLYFDAMVSASVGWELVAPSGSQLFHYDYFDDQEPPLLAESGQYTLLVRGSGDDLSSYQFIIYDVPAPVTTAVAVGQTVNGQIAVPGEYDIYTFSASAGQSLYFENQTASYAPLDWKLTSPSGIVIFSDDINDDQEPPA